MGSKVQSTVGCFPELCFLQFSVVLVFVGLRKQFIINFVFLTYSCAAGFNKNNKKVFKYKYQNRFTLAKVVNDTLAVTSMTEQATVDYDLNDRTSHGRIWPQWPNKPRSIITSMTEQAMVDSDLNDRTSHGRLWPQWQNKSWSIMTSMTEQAMVDYDLNDRTSHGRLWPQWQNKPWSIMTSMTEQVTMEQNLF